MDKAISLEARRVLEKMPYSNSDRSPSNLLNLRSKTRAFIASSVSQSIDKYKAIITNTELNGIPCVVVNPPKLMVGWEILYGFGGGFITGSAFEDLTIAIPISTFSGAKVIIPEYRLAPEHPWPAAIDDILLVYKTLLEKPMALVGESAGGNLALSLMLRAKQLGLPLPSSVALLSPWCDLTNAGDSLSFNEGRDPFLSFKQSEMAAKHYAGENSARLPEISPIFGEFDATFPPCLISTGTRDLLLSQSVKLASAMREKRISIDLRIWEGLWHVFEWDRSLPESETSLEQIAYFLKKNMSYTANTV